MCFILQVLLFAGASAISYLVSGVWHGPPWLGILAEFVFLAAAWFGYVLYQSRHPDWWPTWDEGLPQGTRMLNAFVPVAILLMLVLILMPIFQATRQKALQRRLNLQQQPLHPSHKAASQAQ